MDEIRKLLESTGLSADDLIKKLSEYKSQEVPKPVNGITEKLTNGDVVLEKTSVEPVKNGVCTNDPIDVSNSNLSNDPLENAVIEAPNTTSVESNGLLETHEIIEEEVGKSNEEVVKSTGDFIKPSEDVTTHTEDVTTHTEVVKISENNNNIKPSGESFKQIKFFKLSGKVIKPFEKSITSIDEVIKSTEVHNSGNTDIKPSEEVIKPAEGVNLIKAFIYPTKGVRSMGKVVKSPKQVKPIVGIVRPTFNKNKEKLPKEKVSKLKITELIERRLRAPPPVETVDLTDLLDDDDDNPGCSKSTDDEIVKKQPTFGCLRKRSFGKEKKSAKPPWMFDEDEEEESDNPEPPDVDTGNMREKIFDQIMQLRRKREETPLVSIVNTIPKVYERRPSKMMRDLLQDRDVEIKIIPKQGECSSNYGERSKEIVEGATTCLPIQIVDVRGGAEDFAIGVKNDKINNEDVDNSLEGQNEDENSSNSVEKKPIINYELDGDVIEVTKTNDYTKIKGWKKKKMLITVKDEDVKPIPNVAVPDVPQETKVVINIPVLCDTTLRDPLASCSYIKDEFSNADGASKPVVETGTDQKADNKVVDTAINVFASNNLEGFLKQKDLNISYTVPNLKSSKQSINLLDNRVIIAEQPEDKGHSDSKRRYTIAETEDTNTLKQNDKTDAYKPRTLAEKRKLLESSTPEAGGKRRRNEPDAVYSDVFYRGKKFQVRSRFSKPIVIELLKYNLKKEYKYVEVNGKRRSLLKANPNKRKPSIYASRLANKEPVITYRPGPLSKKVDLQNNGGTEWQTVIKKLPTLHVDIFPRFQKPVHPRIRRFVGFDSYDVTEERAEFALSALQCEENDKRRKFSFPVPYSYNQDSVLLRRRIKEGAIVPKVEVKAEVVEEEAVDVTVGKVLDGLITCVENKEIENTIIQTDEDFKQEVDEPFLPIQKKTSRNEVIKGSMWRTNSELRRLNVKVIEVNIEEEKESSVCEKPFCKLGCICNSLSGTLLPDHCGQARCIFGCCCGFERVKRDSVKFVLPSGTDIFSERTVSRLQDEATKNLAKVEKEFTQTVIHTNKTIVFSDMKERKRSSKYPKRYRDYVEASDDVPLHFVQVIPTESPDRTVNEDTVKLRECSVRLVALNFDHLIPYCLVHHLYDCHCNGQAEYVVPAPIKCPQNENCEDEPKPKKFKEHIIAELPDPFKVPAIETRYKKLYKNNQCAATSARTRGIISDVYHQRNPSALFKRKLARMFKDDLVLNKEMYHKWFYKKTKSIDDLISIVVDDELEDPLQEDIKIEAVKPSRRKQLLNSRVYGPPSNKAELAMQRRTKKVKKMFPKPIESLSTSNTSAVTETLAQILGENDGREGQFRLLPWSSLMEKYETHVMHIWFVPSDSRLKFIITDTDELPGPGYKNIRTFEQFEDKQSIKIDLIRWVVSREVPGCREADDTLVILRQCPPSWEISGICAKNCSKPAREMPQLLPQSEPPPDVLVRKTKEFVGLANDKYKTSPKIMFANCNFTGKKLAPVEDKGDSFCLPLIISEAVVAALPNILDNCRWRVIKLNSSFSILSFSRNSYRIKCSDIITVMKVCQRYGKTVHVNSEEVSRNYCHKSFGIYMCADHTDKIFVGPYFDYENDDLETLRFVNNILMNTDLFNRMRHNPQISTGIWYKQVNERSVIDLTETEEEPVKKAPESDTDVLQDPLANEAGLAIAGQTTDITLRTLLDPDTTFINSPRSLLKTCAWLSSEGIVQDKDDGIDELFFARLKIVMNYAQLELPEGAEPLCFTVNFDDGLIHGYQLNGKLHVCWPEDRYATKVFNGSNTATDWLKMKLNTHFIRLPSTFQIKVQQVKPAEYMETLMKTTISSKYFLDVHIVGSFGALRAVDVGSFIIEKTEKPGTMMARPVPQSINNCEKYKTSFKKFVSLSFMDEEILNKLKFMLQLEKNKWSQLEKTRKSLAQQKHYLLKKHAALFKNADAQVGDQVRQEFRENWTTQEKVPYNLEMPVEEVICLDSDDEKEEPPKVPPPPVPDSTVKLIDIQKLLQQVDTEIVKSVKPSANLTASPATGNPKPNAATKLKTPVSVLLKKHKIVGVLDSLPKIEKIDLSQFSTEKVSSFLGANIMSSKVMLTKAQLMSLKVLSEQQKSKDPLVSPT